MSATAQSAAKMISANRKMRYLPGLKIERLHNTRFRESACSFG
jgi:hypothetical protein